MNRIVICPMCGAQSEGDKKFCPICGATLSDSSPQSRQPTFNSSNKNHAASTLFNRLQNKKEVEELQHRILSRSERKLAETELQQSELVSASKSVAKVTKKKERPKTFKKKPLGVVKPQSTMQASKGAVLTKEIKEQIIEFLRGLNKLDRNLEASAVVKRDGSLLASAHSSRVKPEMMATISSALFGIAEDCIRAISGGKMRIVTIRAQQVVLMLRSINEETILLLVTTPNSNIGLISMKSELVAQNIADFLLKLT